MQFPKIREHLRGVVVSVAGHETSVR